MEYVIVTGANGFIGKTLVNALSSGLGLDKAEVEQCLEKCGFDTKIRGETLDIGSFAKIADEIGKL